jgi:hypothetical protein
MLTSGFILNQATGKQQDSNCDKAKKEKKTLVFCTILPSTQVF